MGIGKKGMEEELAKEIRLTELRKAILGILGFAGMLTLVALVPNAAGAIVKLTSRKKERVRSALERLKERGLVIETNGMYRLTKKGERVLERETPGIRRPSRWDKKWRVVVFDVPERKRKRRVRLREMLTRIGFLRIQDSVWIYPYDCEELISLIKTDFNLGKEVLYIIADKIERSTVYKRHFHLT